MTGPRRPRGRTGTRATGSPPVRPTGWDRPAVPGHRLTCQTCPQTLPEASLRAVWDHLLDEHLDLLREGRQDEIAWTGQTVPE